MSTQWHKLLDDPGNDLIVLPFRIQRPSRDGWVALIWNDGIYFVAPDCYDPAHYPAGSCIQ